MRIVVCPDKFKGTLTSRDAGHAIERGLRKILRAAEVDVMELSDGGEGFTEILGGSLGAEMRAVEVTGPLGSQTGVPLARLEGRSITEMAHYHAPFQERDPLGAHTIGLGEAIVIASEEAGEVLVGVGGSISTDGGTGAARAVGWRFLDGAGSPLPPGGGNLTRLAAIDASEAAPPPPGRVVACYDVDNPLLGAAGAARVFGPQKGASPSEVSVLAEGSERLAARIQADLGIEVGELAGGGAGGGTAAGLAVFFAADLRSGAALVADSVRLDEHIARADLVVTGEGGLDETSSRGKVTGEVARRARALSVPCLAIVGKAAPGPSQEGFTAVFSLTEMFGAQRAISDPGAAIQDAVQHGVAELF